MSDEIATNDFPITLVYDEPFLINQSLNLRCKMTDKSGQLLRLLIYHYPNYATKRECYKLLDPCINWSTNNNLSVAFSNLRTLFKAIQVKNAIACSTNIGYRLTVPIHIHGTPSFTVISHADIPLFKEIIATHPDLDKAKLLFRKIFKSDLL